MQSKKRLYLEYDPEILLCSLHNLYLQLIQNV